MTANTEKFTQTLTPLKYCNFSYFNVCVFSLLFDTLILGYDAMFFSSFLMPLLNFKTRDHVFCFAINVIYTISPVLYVYNPKFAPYVLQCLFVLRKNNILCVYFLHSNMKLLTYTFKRHFLQYFFLYFLVFAKE